MHNHHDRVCCVCAVCAVCENHCDCDARTRCLDKMHECVSVRTVRLLVHVSVSVFAFAFVRVRVSAHVCAACHTAKH